MTTPPEVIEALITEVCTQKENAADALAAFTCRTPTQLAGTPLAACFTKILAHFAKAERERLFSTRAVTFTDAALAHFDPNAKVRVVRTLTYEANAQDMDRWLARSVAPGVFRPVRGMTLTIEQSRPDYADSTRKPMWNDPSVITQLGPFNEAGIKGVYAILDNAIVSVQYDTPIPQAKDAVLGLTFGVKAVEGLAEALDEAGDPAADARIATLIADHCAADVARGR